MAPRQKIRFVRNGRVVEAQASPPTRMLLDHLRLTERATGTKEGCNEGDCGACTVVLARPKNGGLDYRPVNSCITMLGQVDGSEVIAIEDLAASGQLHPVQQAMVDHHGSQCGFCTPGIVMSLFAAAHGPEPLDRPAVLDGLAGNLCRCTGYRPIVEAALSAAPACRTDAFAASEGARLRLLESLADGDDLFSGDEHSFFAAPVSVEALAELYERHPDAVLLGGATDVGLWVTKQLRTLPKIIWLGRIAALQRIEDFPDRLRIGAGVTFAEAIPALAALDPDLGELLRRIGARQVRGAGTIGGNIANGSPIGDSPPALIALGAILELRRGRTIRHLQLEDFFLEYGRQDRQAGEFVSAVTVRKPAENTHFRAYKVSKRYDQDISALLGAFSIEVDGDRVAGARIAYGGMAGTPKRALATEAALVGGNLSDPAGWEPAVAALAKDFAPLSDMRASRDYRLAVAGNLLRKALHEIGGAPSGITRVFGRREGGHAADAA